MQICIYVNRLMICKYAYIIKLMMYRYARNSFAFQPALSHYCSLMCIIHLEQCFGRGLYQDKQSTGV